MHLPEHHPSGNSRQALGVFCPRQDQDPLADHFSCYQVLSLGSFRRGSISEITGKPRGKKKPELPPVAAGLSLGFVLIWPTQPTGWEKTAWAGFLPYLCHNTGHISWCSTECHRIFWAGRDPTRIIESNLKWMGFSHFSPALGRVSLHRVFQGSFRLWMLNVRDCCVLCPCQALITGSSVSSLRGVAAVWTLQNQQPLLVIYV